MINDSGDSGFKKLSTINRRMFIFSAAKAVVFFGIVGRLFSLQINENKKYLTLSDKNRLRESRLPPVRGEFKDFFGNTIAGNLKVYQLHVIPEQVENFKDLMIRLKNILYENQNTIYSFNPFKLVSKFDSKNRSIFLDFPGLLEGNITGDFKIKDTKILFKNFLSGFYSKNFSKISGDQYLNFDLKLQKKFLEILYPKIRIENNSSIFS